MGNLGRGKQHGRSIPTRCHTRPTPNTVGRIKSSLRILFANRHRIRVWGLPRVHRNKPARLNDSVKRRSIGHQILDHRKCPRPPRFYRQSLSISKRSQINLAGRRALIRPVRFPIDHHGTRTTDPLPTIVLKRNRLLPFPRQPIIHHIHHLQKRHVRIQTLRLVQLKVSLALFRFLPPNLEV